MPLITLSLLLLLLHLAYKHLRFKNLSLTVSVSRRKLFEGDRVKLTQTISNAKILPLPLVEVSFLTCAFVNDENNGEIHAFTSSVGAYRRVTQVVTYNCVKRGFYPLNTFKLHVCDLLMNNHQTRDAYCNETITVYPRVITPSFETNEIVSALSLMPDNFYIKGIREYRPEDDARDINHAASAYTGKLMTNEYESVGTKEVCVVLNLMDYTTVKDNPLNEEMIRPAAFFARKLLGKSGITLSFVSNGRDAETGEEIFIKAGTTRLQETKILEALARTDLKRKARPIAETMAKINTQSKTFLLISKEEGDETRAWFNSVKPNGEWVRP